MEASLEHFFPLIGVSKKEMSEKEGSNILQNRDMAISRAGNHPPATRIYWIDIPIIQDIVGVT